jgi:hypothetical protein
VRASVDARRRRIVRTDLGIGEDSWSCGVVSATV